MYTNEPMKVKELNISSSSVQNNLLVVSILRRYPNNILNIMFKYCSRKEDQIILPA